MAKLEPDMRVKYVGITKELIGHVGKVIGVKDGTVKVLWDNKDDYYYHPWLFLKPIDEEENIESIW